LEKVGKKLKKVDKIWKNLGKKMEKSFKKDGKNE
jgi:hypothetical protein